MEHKEKVERTRSETPAAKSYKRPELKKHGKLKNKASQTTVVYTYYYIT